MNIQNIGTIVKITLFRQFTALIPSANLWIDVAGYNLAKRATTDDCVEPCFSLLQYPPNNL